MANRWTGGALIVLGLVVVAILAFGQIFTGPPEDHAIVTFEVAGGEQFRVELITADLVENAQKLLDGEEAPSVPNGPIVRGDPGVNAPWSWHIDPTEFEFADATTEVCDAIPSDVEDGIITSDMFCPWSAQVVALDPAP
jgi:hypothetical protein